MQTAHRSWRFTLPAVLLASIWATAPAQAGPLVAYENLPTNLDGTLMESHHGVGGPILADDFVAAVGGNISRVEWWGSAAASNNWELAFHTNDPALNQPNIDNAFTGAFVKYGAAGDLVAVGEQVGTSDIFHFTANIAGPQIVAGTEYWFTVANFAAGWQWAQALNGPTVGSENFNTHQSTGVGLCGDGGPHCGPWVDVHTDNAFRLSVPEPGSLALVALAGLLLTTTRRRDNGSAGPATPLAV